jgi:hypothetical protein
MVINEPDDDRAKSFYSDPIQTSTQVETLARTGLPVNGCDVIELDHSLLHSTGVSIRVDSLIQKYPRVWRHPGCC